MSLRQMRYFIAVAESGSFSAASRALSVSQPALCYQLKALEDRLGVTLLRRHSRGVAPTQAGEVLLEHARAAVEAFGRAERSIDRFRGDLPVELTLGVAPTPGRALLPDLLDATGAGNALRLTVHQRLSDELVAAIEAGSLDAALCYDPPGAPASRNWRLYGEDLFLVGPPDLVGEGTDEVPFEALAGFPLVLDGRMRAMRSRIDAVAASREVALDLLEMEPINVKREMILRHGRCSIVPYGLFFDEIRDGRLRARRIVGPALTRTLHLLVAGRVGERPAAILHELVRELVEAGIAGGKLGWRAPDTVAAVLPRAKVG